MLGQLKKGVRVQPQHLLAVRAECGTPWTSLSKGALHAWTSEQLQNQLRLMNLPEALEARSSELHAALVRRSVLAEGTVQTKPFALSGNRDQLQARLLDIVAAMQSISPSTVGTSVAGASATTPDDDFDHDL